MFCCVRTSRVIMSHIMSTFLEFLFTVMLPCGDDNGQMAFKACCTKTNVQLWRLKRKHSLDDYKKFLTHYFSRCPLYQKIFMRRCFYLFMVKASIVLFRNRILQWLICLMHMFSFQDSTGCIYNMSLSCTFVCPHMKIAFLLLPTWLLELSLLHVCFRQTITLTVICSCFFIA